MYFGVKYDLKAYLPFIHRNREIFDSNNNTIM